MISGSRKKRYTLTCDHCGEEERFGSFNEAVNYKTDKDNGWASVKDENEDWQDLCPDCYTPEVINKLRGYTPEVINKLRGYTPNSTKALDNLEFEW
jgi:hypothetical protein